MSAIEEGVVPEDPNKLLHVTIDFSQAAGIMEAEATAYSEGMEGPPEDLLLRILECWPELGEYYSWLRVTDDFKRGKRAQTMAATSTDRLVSSGNRD